MYKNLIWLGLSFNWLFPHYVSPQYVGLMVRQVTGIKYLSNGIIIKWQKCMVHTFLGYEKNYFDVVFQKLTFVPL